MLALARTIDAARAVEVEARLSAALSVDALALGTLLSCAYPALFASIEASPDLVRELCREGFSAPREPEPLLTSLALRAGDPSEGDAFMERLRRAARFERLRIAARELLPAALGGADVDVTAREITALAEATIELSLREAVSAARQRTGLPMRNAAEPGRFVVLGMGKLGGGELNAGSDVDLIYFYDADEGEAVASDGSTSTPHEVWTRVARRLTANLEQIGADGALWRVDLRLRPEGSTGPVVNSIAAAERYYESFGRLWERAALLRGRPVAGDRDFGDELMAMLAPFVWRRRVDPSIAVEMTDLVRRARVELTRGDDDDLKLGVGGIREAEFFVQTLQLVWGGREGRVRARGTLDALRRLRATGLVTDREGREIADAYLALRRAEHAIQTSTGLPTHSLPRDSADRERLARTLGFPDMAAFARDLAAHRMRVARRFASLIPGGAPAASPFLEALSALDRADAEAFRAALHTSFEGLGDAARSELARDLFALSTRPDSPLGSRARETYPGLAETLLEAIADAADPEQAARYLRVLFSRLRQPAIYARLLGSDPRAVRRLVATLGASAFIGDAVVSNPELGDLVLFAHPVPTADLARQEIERATEALLRAGADDEEDDALMGALRRAKARVVIEVGLADLAGELGTRDATLILSSLADASLEAATRRALGTEPGAPIEGLAVLAMGKLGGREIGYGSDLDVVFLYDPERAPPGVDPAVHFTRAARRIIRIISMSHSAGRGYELDTRLRPSGSQGLLVVSLEAFARYHEPRVERRDPGRNVPGVHSATWERMALLRARAAAGDSAIGASASAIAERVAYTPREEKKTIAAEVHRLRVRMERELAHERPGRYDIKLGRGGLADVEFTVQFLQLVSERPRVRTQETPLAIDAIADEGLVAADQAETLREGYRFLRRLEQRIRVVHADSGHLIEAPAPGLRPLARRMGLRDRPFREGSVALLDRYREVTEGIRAVYEAVVVGATQGGQSEPS